MPLTDLQCKKATCPSERARERFTDAGGLYLEVLPSGGKHWRWKYRFAGKEKRLALGTFPDVPLSKARLDRDAARLTLKSGSDPVQEKLDAKAARRIAVGNSFEAIARAWFDHWKATKTERHSGYVLRRLEADVFPQIGQKPMADIEAKHLIAIAKKIEQRNAVDIAKRALQTCGQIMRYAVAHGIIDRNPAADIKPGDALKARKKVNYARIEIAELPQLLRRIDAYHGSPYTRLAMQLMALTFVRTTELIAAHWSEFNLKAAEWRVPAERTKMRTTHIVPLSRQAVDVLTTLREIRSSGLLFPGERDHDRPMSNNTILMALDRMGYKHRMTGHGFRGLASTVLHELGYEHEVIELQLAHLRRNAVHAAYDYSKRLKERRALMQAWGDHVDALRRGAKLHQLRKAA